MNDTCRACGNTPKECMCLPAGMTCSDCLLFIRCKRLIGSLTGKETTCDWHPVRFTAFARSASREEASR